MRERNVEARDAQIYMLTPTLSEVAAWTCISEPSINVALHNQYSQLYPLCKLKLLFLYLAKNIRTFSSQYLKVLEMNLSMGCRTNEMQRVVKRTPVCETPAEVAVSELAGCQFKEAECVTARWQLFVSGKFAANWGRRHSQGPLHESTCRHGLRGLPRHKLLCSPRSSLFLVGTESSPVTLKPGGGYGALNSISYWREMFFRGGRR